MVAGLRQMGARWSPVGGWMEPGGCLVESGDGCLVEPGVGWVEPGGCLSSAE